ncbi:hypothetical protein ANANG_G00220370 [Anguilla anguilla]|uniref:C2H2-type domain-containing protein n=1 Tax=Anguilla anguilla TaxID=7936 RepID=A0A9D3LW34_ANGAN|nr:hypothetical protein ANANG_G00220370 [Anguilla anguilla]
MSLSVSATSVPKSALVTNACTSCAYKTFYPEVLLMHIRLAHRDKLEPAKKSHTRSSIAALKRKRHTGCPPALEGKDVSPLPHFYRKHPRRTKSPAALADAHSGRPLAAPRFADPERDCFVVSVKPPVQDKDRPAVNGAAWPRRAALPPRPFGDPAGGLRRALRQEGEVLRPPRGRRAAGRLHPTEAGGEADQELSSRQPLLQNTPPHGPRQAPGKVPETDWNVINILRSYSPSDLASLYHPTAGSSHSAFSAPTAGSRPVPYQQHPNSALQRRSGGGPASGARCGPADKSA